MRFNRNQSYFETLYRRIKSSRFRSSFSLSNQELIWLKERGIETARIHARNFIEQRLAPSVIHNDGRQTPMKGHPVFIAQHATGCCCRKCLQKWHHIPSGRALRPFEKRYIEEVLIFWLEKQSCS